MCAKAAAARLIVTRLNISCRCRDGKASHTSLLAALKSAQPSCLLSPLQHAATSAAFFAWNTLLAALAASVLQHHAAQAALDGASSTRRVPGQAQRHQSSSSSQAAVHDGG
jgi:hypothetical protein